MKTAVVILNWNGEMFLKQFLSSVITHTDLSVNEIVVVAVVTIMDMIMVEVLVELSNQNNLMVDVVVTNPHFVSSLKAQEFIALGLFYFKD